MVKLPSLRVIVAITSLVCGVYGEGITNISQCMNTNLTSDVLTMFPADATSSPQRCVLAFVKGSVSGDLRTFASPFASEILASEFGFSSVESIPAAVSNEFATLMSSITNSTCKVISYGEVTTNGLIRAHITLHRQGENYNRAEACYLDISQTNGVWRIVSWDACE